MLLFFDFHSSTGVLSVLIYRRKAEKMNRKVLECWLFVTIQEQFALFRLFQGKNFISKSREKVLQKNDAIRKGLLRAIHETENSTVISFFFPLGNPFIILRDDPAK